MPFARKKPKAQHARVSELQNELEREWRNPQTAPDRPVIIEEEVKQPHPTVHLYVVWDAWASLAQRERSELMMDVYEAVKGRDAALDVTIAMGLTNEEARNTGLEWEQVAP